VRHEHERIVSVTVSNGSQECTVLGDAFVSSIPMTELVQCLHPGVDGSVVAAARALTYRGVITVNLMLNRPRVTHDTWVYVHDPLVSFARLHEPRNWSAALAPEGKTSLVLELFCDAGDDVWRRSDAELIDLVVRDLSSTLGFVDHHDVLDGFTIRSPDAYPRYSLRYRDAVDTIKACLRSFGNLCIVGRGGTFRYNNTDHAIETGLLAARHLLGEDASIDGVNSEPEYLEERRVNELAWTVASTVRHDAHTRG
jgi:protoporphyrinogen oxidase